MHVVEESREDAADFLIPSFVCSAVLNVDGRLVHSCGKPSHKKGSLVKVVARKAASLII